MDLIQQFLDGNENAIWFSCPSRSVNYTARVLECTGNEAVTHIVDGLLKLKEADFVRTVVVFDEPKDEYGLENHQGHNWYIKFSISEEDGETFLDELSFHPNEHPLKLANGKVLPATYSED